MANISPAWLEKLSESQLSDFEAVLEEEIDRCCGRDPLHWLQNWTLTENPKHQEQGLAHKAPFPRKSYFVPLFAEFRRAARLFIPKTREMLTSWCVMGYACHRAQWDNWLVVCQTDSQGKAEELISYVRILWENQPEFLKERHRLKGDGSRTNMEWERSGRVLAIPSGVHKIRLYHPTLYVMDEAAFLPEAESCYNAAQPVAQQIIAISSAGPGWFGDQCAK